MNTVSVTKLEDLQTAYDGSYYTIIGAGGSVVDWIESYERRLTEQGIGTPTEWFGATGAQVNGFAGYTRLHPADEFAGDLTFLLFPLDGLHAGRLAMFKLRMEDRWFDDVVDNMRRRATS